MASDLEKARDGIAIVGELIKIAGDDPSVKEAAGNLGKAALTLSRTINNALLPLAAVNFAFDKAKNYFSEKFEQDISEKAKNIPKDFLVEPRALIAGAALQGLAFAHEDASLREMFLNLLATSMDSRRSAHAHPAFVEIIKQLDSQEAVLLTEFLTSRKSYPVGPIGWLRRMESDGFGYVDIKRHVLNFADAETSQPKEIPGMTVMVENWIRLGLVVVEYGPFLKGDENYAWLEKRPEFLVAKAENNEKKKKIAWEKGNIRVTELGISFSKAIGVGDDESVVG